MDVTTISDFLKTHALRRPDHPAYIYSTGMVTWKQLDTRVNALVAGFRKLGLRKGDVIAACVADGPVQIELLYAAARLGAVRVGLNYRFTATDIAKLVAHSGARLAIAEGSCRSLLDGCSVKLGIVDAGDGQGNRGDYESLLDFDAVAHYDPAVGSDIAQICYTTGSTGSPKGAIWLHRAVVHAMAFTLLDIGVSENDVYLHCLPAAGVPSVLATWNVMLGFTTVVMPRFQPDQALELIERHRCTFALLIPTMLTALCEEAERNPRDVSSMRKILYGSASTPPALIRRGGKIFKEIEFEQIYGSTEGTGGWFTKLSPADHKKAMSGNEGLLSSCGRQTIHTRVQILDDNDNPCETGEVGEICIAGDHVMEGYYKEEELTRKVLRDGWLHTGDLGRLDKDGYLYLVDRKQFMIITGGYNVYPIEVENVISSHPDVLEVCVFGVPDYRWGEAVHAVVVARAGSTVCADDLKHWCKANLAQFKRPKSIEFRDALMRGATGKILKRAEQARTIECLASVNAQTVTGP
ncbi:class I adenylate-forming enzyme family protein [Paraburkholderia fungorum]|uniref:class I adenylate-forming enzyme family protein n=1 Tax=Paraburkholderia fungorum TaxID=134537 RepID=UPI00209831E8|nr:AMP-binding protein [Paraburkholderia fungorum]USX06627.1 AMP-binding protein [Paraburkholderia fungorum]